MQELLKSYIMPELLVLVPVLYFIGKALKHSKWNDRYIPLTLGVISCALSLLYVASTCAFSGAKDALFGIFTALTQGVLIAGASVYVNELISQKKKDE